MKKSSEFVFLFLGLIAAFGFFAFLVYYARNPTEQYTPRARKPAATAATRVSAASGASPAGAPQVDMADPSVPMAKKGEQLFGIHCAMCHQPDARGKIGFAPSIRNRDFLALASDDFIRRTIQEGRPGTAMAPRPDLDGKQVNAIIDFLRSIPAANPIEVEVDWSATYAGDVSAGQEKYTAFCASCHGQQGQGYAAGVPGTGIGLPGFLKVASDDYIYKTLKVGRIGTPMQPFLGARGLANLEDQDAYDIIAYLRRLGEINAGEEAQMAAGPPSPKRGETQFNINCSGCHQVGGEGKIGFAPSIRNRDFLALASDEFIRETIQDGRPGTAMMPRPDLSERVVDDIIAYLRDLPVENEIEIDVDPSLSFEGDESRGSEMFANYCASCHGPKGEGYAIGVPGTAIGLPGFAAASDDYIFKTLKHGRIGTPMKSFLGARGLANLSTQDAYDIIAHLRTLQSQPLAAVAEDEASIYE